MNNFQKPENALKRAAELRAIGQSDEALTILHSAIGHKFFRTQGWDMVQEQIMLEYVALCIDQDKLRMARDGLHQYRLISQHANIASLGKVIVELLDRAESRLKKIKSVMPESDSVKSGLLEEGMEYEESPEDLMASTLQIEMRDQKTKNLHDVYRFLWEIYKIVLDIMRATPKLEKVYHETARKAINFCKENGRLVEFKRLCDVLRGHYAFLLKVQNKPEMECMLKPELHIETKINQLIASCEIGMWKEAFNTVEDLYSLGIRDYITKTFQGSVSILGSQKEKLLKWLAIFYEKLALIFWVSDLLLFHALAVIRYVMHIRMYKKKVTQEEMKYLLSKCVMAVLAVPNNSNFVSKSNEFSSLETSSYEMQKRMATLLGYNTIPTKESLHYYLETKNVLNQSDENVQNLYDLMENDNPMKLCVKIIPLLENIKGKVTINGTNTTNNQSSNNTAKLNGVLPGKEEKPNEVLVNGDVGEQMNGTLEDKLEEGKEKEEKFNANKLNEVLQKAKEETLEKYFNKVKKVVFHKVLLRLSKVYASMTIEFFKKSICPREFYEWNRAEKEIADLVHKGLVHIRIDYTNKVLYFNISTVKSDSIASIRHQLTDLGKNLYYAMRLLNPEEVNKTNEQRRLQLISMKNNIDKERMKLLKRTTEIYQRRQEHQEEQMRVEEERKKMELQQKINEEKAEKERREEIIRQMEMQRKKDEKYKLKSEVATQILMEIKKLSNQSSAKIHVKGKQLEDLTVEDLIEGVVDYEDIEKAQEEYMLKERHEFIKQRKVEVRRVENLLRAIRDCDKEMYEKYMENLIKQDTELLMEIKKKREDKYKQDAQEMLEEKNLFKKLVEVKKEWIDEKMKDRIAEYEEKYEEQNKKIQKKLLTEKIARARVRYQQEMKRRQQEEQMRIEEENRRKLEEQKKEEELKKKMEMMRLKEEEEKRKKQEELRRQKLDEIAKIQRQKEEEIERKLAESHKEVQQKTRGLFSRSMTRDQQQQQPRESKDYRQEFMRDRGDTREYLRDNREFTRESSKDFARERADSKEFARDRDRGDHTRERGDSKDYMREREPKEYNQEFTRDRGDRQDYTRETKEFVRDNKEFGRETKDPRDGYTREPRDGFDRNNVGLKNEGDKQEEEGWRNEVKKTTNKVFRGFNRKINKKPSDDEGSWRR